MKSLARSICVTSLGTLLLLAQGCEFDAIFTDADDTVHSDDLSQSSNTEVSDTILEKIVNLDTDRDPEPQDTGSENDTESVDTETDYDTHPQDTGPADYKDLICWETNGSWDETACGDYLCSDKPDCAGGAPSGGCDCGPLGKYDQTYGCVTDIVCFDTERCAGDAATLDFSACESLAPIGAAYNHTTEACQTVFGCPEALPEGFQLFGDNSLCTMMCDGCSSNADCDENQYCDYAKGSECGALLDGTCKLRNEICAMIYDPVCTCEFHIAGSACSASTWGKSIQFDGECAQSDVCNHNGGVWDDSSDSCSCPQDTTYNFMRGCEPNPI